MTTDIEKHNILYFQPDKNKHFSILTTNNCFKIIIYRYVE